MEVRTQLKVRNIVKVQQRWKINTKNQRIKKNGDKLEEINLIKEMIGNQKEDQWEALRDKH